MPKAIRDPEKTRAHILETAFIEIYQRGFRAVSINDIVDKTRVTKGAFFHHFPTKQDLGYALVDEMLKSMIIERWIAPLAAYNNPVQGIITRFRKIIDSTPDESISFGCPLNNLIQEMAPIDPIFSEKLKNVMTLWIEENERYLKKAQEQGYLKKNVNTRQLAEYIVMIEEAAYGMAKVMGDRNIFESAHNSLKQHLTALAEK